MTALLTAQPQTIWCVGRNYVEHIHELDNEIPDEMVVFCKPASAISETLVAFRDEPIHFETELCLRLGESGVSHIGLGLDLTKRGLQKQLKDKGLPWERAKAFPGAAVFSDFVEIAPGIDWSTVSFTLHVDGELQQMGRCDMMIHSPSAIETQLSETFALRAGDVVMTGTPAGVGELNKGKTYRAALYIGDDCLVSQSWEAL